MMWKIGVLITFLCLSCHKNVNSFSVKENTVDSILISLWNSIEANNYYFNVTETEILITSEYFSFNRRVSDSAEVAKINNYIDDFYLSKTKDIIIKKSALSYTRFVHSNSISVKVFKNGELIVNEKQKLSEDKYDIEFNSDFIDLTNSLEDMIE